MHGDVMKGNRADQGFTDPMQSSRFGGENFGQPQQILIGEYYGGRFEYIEVIVFSGNTSAGGFNGGGSNDGYLDMSSHASYGLFGDQNNPAGPISGPAVHDTPPRGVDLSPVTTASQQTGSSDLSTAVVNKTSLNSTGRLDSAPANAASRLSTSVFVPGASLSQSRIGFHSLQIDAEDLALSMATKSDLNGARETSGNGLQLQNVNGIPHTIVLAKANSSSADQRQILPQLKSSLIGMPFDLPAVERALHTVMSEMESLGTQVSSWLDEAHLWPLAAAVSTAALGAGAAYYVRRQGALKTDREEEEASSSWLFLRLQPHPGE